MRENAFRNSFHTSSICASSRKDIHDLNGIHCYWRNAAAVTLAVHNNHEEVTARNLLYDKRSATQTETEAKCCKINSSTLNMYSLMSVDIVNIRFINSSGLKQYLIQPSQSMLPVVSLMVRSETKAGYSVSHGTIVVLPRDL